MQVSHSIATALEPLRMSLPCPPARLVLLHDCASQYRICKTAPDGDCPLGARVSFLRNNHVIKDNKLNASWEKIAGESAAQNCPLQPWLARHSQGLPSDLDYGVLVVGSGIHLDDYR